MGVLSCKKCLYWDELDKNRGYCNKIDLYSDADAYISVQMDDDQGLSAKLVTCASFFCAYFKGRS